MLALNALGLDSPESAAGRDWLAEGIGTQGWGLKTTPFYSTLRLDVENYNPVELMGRAQGDPDHIIEVNNTCHGISFYYDIQGILTTILGLAALNLVTGKGKASEGVSSKPRQCYDRYQCERARDYIRDFSLSPYIKDSVRNNAH